MDLGYKAYKALRKPVLSLNNINNIDRRLEFAQSHLQWTDEDWTNIIFTDESFFRLVNSSGRVFARGTKENDWRENTLQTSSTHSGSLMVWGAISINGCGPLVRLEGSIDAEGYLDAFHYRLKRYYPELYEGDIIFQHDNAPVHTAVEVTEWFRVRNISVMEWPSKSPDLNIIENALGIIKHELRSKVYEDLEELWSEIQSLWKNIITPEFIRTLYRSMRRRINAVIQAAGRHTKYQVFLVLELNL